MMKKLMLSVLSLATMLTLTHSVYALGSTDINTEPESEEMKDVPNSKLEFNNNYENLGAETDVVLEQISELNASKPLNEVIKEDTLNLEGLQLLTMVQDLNFILDGKVLTNDEIKALGIEKLTVTWEVQNLTSNMDADVLHYSTKNQAWEVLEATENYANKTVTCTFTDLSPVAVIYKLKPTESKPNTSKPSTGYDDGGPFTTDACGNVFDRWGNEVYHSPVCVNNSVDNNGDYNFVNTSDR